jgi:FdhD protein
MIDSNKTRFTHYQNNAAKISEQELILEEPLSIRIEGNPYSVVMRTPGDEIAHVAGFCLAEGIVDQPDDIVTIGFCTEEETNVATVTLTPDRKNRIAEILERRDFVSQTSCGICGKEVIADIRQILSPLGNTVKITVDQALACADMLPSHQKLFKKTRSSHAALIFDARIQPIYSAEDVGRHNALDKVIGKAFMKKKIKQALLGVMSSRLSYELVQKAARAGLEIMIGISRPTALAVDLARSLNMTLACAKDRELMVFCGEQRIYLP